MENKKIKLKHINIKSILPAPGTNNLFNRLKKLNLGQCMDNYR